MNDSKTPIFGLFSLQSGSRLLIGIKNKSKKRLKKKEKRERQRNPSVIWREVKYIQHVWRGSGVISYTLMTVDHTVREKNDWEYKVCISSFKSGENTVESEKNCNFYTSQQFSTSFRKRTRNWLFLTKPGVTTTETTSKILYPVNILRNAVLLWIYTNLGHNIIFLKE